MPSAAELYNQEVLEGHREALAALRELLATETNRTERRRLATAILKTRKVKTADPEALIDRGPTGRKGDTSPPPAASHPVTQHVKSSADHDPARKAQIAQILSAVIAGTAETEIIDAISAPQAAELASESS